MFLKIICELLNCNLVNHRLNLRISELALGLTLELAFRQLNGDYRIYRLADSLAAVSRKRLFFLALLGRLFLWLILLLGFLVSLGVVVYDLAQSLLESDLVSTALAGVNIVRKGAENLAVEIGGILERDFNVYSIHVSGKIDNVRMENIGAALLIEPFDVAADTAFVHHFLVNWVLRVAGI